MYYRIFKYRIENIFNKTECFVISDQRRNERIRISFNDTQ